MKLRSIGLLGSRSFMVIASNDSGNRFSLHVDFLPMDLVFFEMRDFKWLLFLDYLSILDWFLLLCMTRLYWGILLWFFFWLIFFWLNKKKKTQLNSAGINNLLDSSVLLDAWFFSFFFLANEGVLNMKWSKTCLASWVIDGVP